MYKSAGLPSSTGTHLSIGEKSGEKKYQVIRGSLCWRGQERGNKIYIRIIGNP